MAKAVLQSNIQASDAGLTVAAGATVTIRNSDTLGLATLYTTRAGATTTANPTTADADGFFRVYLDPGRYNITATYSGDTQTFNDVVAQENSPIVPVENVTALKAISPIDDYVVYLKGHTTVKDGGGGEFIGVTGAAPGTYTDDNGITILPTGGDGSAAWIRTSVGPYLPQLAGGLSNGTTDCSDAFLAIDNVTDVIHIIDGIYQIDTDTAIDAVIMPEGGQVRVATGITFTCGGVVGDDSSVVFLGDGTVILKNSTYSLGNFEGDAANDKWDFLRRGLVAGKAWKFIVPRPKSDDSAAIDKGATDGVLWKLTAPMEFGDPENFVSIELHAGFSAEPAAGTLSSMWQFGDASAKTEVIDVTGMLRLNAGSRADVGLLIEGAGHVEIPNVYIDSYGSAIKITAQVHSSNDIRIGHIYGAQGRLLDLNAASGRIFDLQADFIDSEGDSIGATDCIVYIQGGCRNIKIGKVNQHAVVTGFADCTNAVVLIENDPGGTAPASGITIDKVSNRSTTITSDGVRVRDTTSGVGTKSSEITINSADSPGTDAIDLDYCTSVYVGSVVSGNTRLTSTVDGVYLDGVKIPDIIDGGAENLRINGRRQHLLTLADDTATSLAMTSGLTTGCLVYVGANTSTARYSAIVFVNTTASPACYALTAGADVDVTTGILSGTTGADTQFTISARGDGTVYFENRTGVSLTIFVEFAG